MDGVRWAGDRAILRTFAGDVSDANRAALALSRALRDDPEPEVEDVVPGARSVLVVLREGADPGERLRARLAERPRRIDRDDGTTHRIAVAYGGEDGPDLARVAARAGLDESAVVRAHADATYTVAFVGFSPGFPYLLGLPRALATPRLTTPRTSVRGGSVGIGETWTGVYPRRSPGGWNLIGRCEATLFDLAREPASVLVPGDRVRFVAT